MIYIFTILLLLLTVQNSIAAIRYASPSGGGTACTVISTPCTLSTASSQAVAGDEVILLNGTYTSALSTVNNGSPGAYITFRAQNRWGAVISVNISGGGALVINRNYIIISGIDFNGNNTTQNLANYVLGASGTTLHDTIVEYCRFRGGRLAGIRFGFGTVTNAQQFNHVFRYNIVENVGFQDNAPGEAFYVGHNPVVGADAVDQYHDIEIYGNWISAFLEQGVDVKDTSSRISIHDNVFTGQLVGSDRGFVGTTNDGTISLGGDNNRVYNNILYNNKAGSWAILAQDGGRHEVYNNVVYNQISGGTVSDGWWAFSPNSGQTKVYNNTFWNMSSHSASISSAAAVFTVINNAGVNGVTGNTAATSMTSAYFVNATNGDFRLTASATNLLESGGTSPSSTTDIAGNPSIGSRDSGAWEYQGPIGNIFYVSTNGSDSNSCADSKVIGKAKRNFKGASGAMACLGQGDTLNIDDGLYTTETDIGAISSQQVPNGISATQRTIIKAANTRQVTIRPPSGTGAFFIFDGKKWITLQGIIFDAVNVGGNGLYIGRSAVGQPATTDISIIDCDGTNADPSTGGGGISIGFNQDGVDNLNILVQNCRAYNNGSIASGSLVHGIYSSGQNVTIDGGEYHDNQGHGVHVFGHDVVDGTTGTIVRNVSTYNNGSVGIGLYNGTNLTAYNNLVYNNGNISNVSGIAVRFNAQANVYNCTVYGNDTNGFFLTSSTISNIQNNIIFNNGGVPISDSPGTSVKTNNVTSNPLFVNAGIGDFHLLTGSPAIGAALNLAPLFDTDFDGILRSIPWDAGAFEAAPGSGSITLLEPVGGQIWHINTRRSFRWTSSGSIPNVKITINRGASPETIIASTPNNGQFDWPVTGTANSATVTARVESATDSSVIGTNPTPYTIKFHEGGDYEKVISDNTTGTNIGTPGTEDTRLRLAAPTTNLGTDISLSSHKMSAGDHSIALLRFDGLHKEVPTEAVITEASVTLLLSWDPTPPTTRTLTFRRVLRNWVESQATWNIYSTGNNWTTPGALGLGSDISNIVSGTMTFGASGLFTANTAQMKTDVQGWSNLTVTNNGWMIERTDGQDDGAFDGCASSDNTGTDIRPVLRVKYSVVPRPPENLEKIP